MAAVDYFLKLDGIDGESSDSKHKGEIDIESFSWGLSNPGSPAPGGGGGGGVGRASFQDFHFTARLSKASPKLFLACASGQRIRSAQLTSRKAGHDQQEFYIIKMTDLLVSSFQQGGANPSDAVPTDQFSLNYAKVELSYSPQRPDGSPDAPVKAGWDVAKNVKI